ncbi:MAG: hypothetical protein KDC18_15715 [Alphaproteobacteria bacterium]|nr:hypothetical protein [Alphaproteobacteria bacterium]MCB9928880.1 hypothetical protein [Alphaproteobacteria bacterium]
MSRYNKAWAAGIAQAAIQIAAAFVPFDPELEQALGVVLTAAIVLLVPNRPADPATAKPEATLRSPVWVGLAAIGLAVLLGACSGLGDTVGDGLLGPDCGPESRAKRAELLTERVLARYPSVANDTLTAAVAGMYAAAADGGDMEAASVAYQSALAASLVPVIGASIAEPVLLHLSRMPGAAQDFLVIRSQLAAFCAAAGA